MDTETFTIRINGQIKKKLIQFYYSGKSDKKWRNWSEFIENYILSNQKRSGGISI